ncbi:uncharacterized protein KGF55_001178 [Candida pseudojiufengensis]|uniref:uncharacterized protein n=1 Tax=Candida pseudojiufengensis TaxID=497109 RepID=UPI0022243FE7|nr:uncharacterized protein KGF55_001178 [Candida pseudojiufengensis]KAI5965815.1 hypothetical protein KGF55_001178 [Candida pseudojiufengensis]
MEIDVNPIEDYDTTDSMRLNLFQQLLKAEGIIHILFRSTTKRTSTVERFHRTIGDKLRCCYSHTNHLPMKSTLDEVMDYDKLQWYLPITVV